MNYIINNDFSIQVGFTVNSQHIHQAIIQTNSQLSELPSTLFTSIDFKTTSAMIGALFCATLASLTGSMVNPIEKGHPDIVPCNAVGATEEQLRQYPEGLEIKCTVGGITQGANLRAGETRIGSLTGVTWQAHHREVRELLGLVWDFVNSGEAFNYPTITGAFYANNLVEDDWGAISGTTGRNTKVSAMKVGGKHKMGAGWVSLIDSPAYRARYGSLLNINA